MNVAKRSDHANSSATAPLKYQEMSPEVTLVEFISTSAAFHGVKKENIKQLEWDILKVFPNNVMPANAAAWYMAKRRFYMDNTYENQLLPFLLKNYPKKFLVKGNTVEFLESYTQEVARKKMHQMVRQGLLAYFTHKVDEYGVYFFDPYYYETTEPFHANLRQVTNSASSQRSKLLPNYFALNKQHFVYQAHSPYLVTISRESVDVRTNTTGIIVSMIDNQFGIIQFPSGTGTEKAFFSAKSLFRDGWIYQGDPMKLPPMEFDGYRLPSARNKSSDGHNSFTWYAVLVWCGRKPSPKYCSTKEDLASNPYFQGQGGHVANHGGVGVTYEELVAKAVKSQQQPPLEKGGCMQVGEVLSIRKNGAIVSLGKDSEERAFIPGWSHRNLKFSGNFLTTTQGVELAIKDLITFCLDPTQVEKGFEAVGCNVTVLKHAAEKKSTGVSASNSGHLLQPAGDAGSSSATLPSSVASGGGIKKSKNQRNAVKDRNRAKSASERKDGKGDGTSDEEGSKGKVTKRKAKNNNREKKLSENKPRETKSSYIHFLLSAEVDASDVYDSDEDPSFLAPTFHDPELDYDEYSDGEIPDEEKQMLVKELAEEFDVEDLKKKIAESENAEEAEKNKSGNEEVSSKSGEDQNSKDNGNQNSKDNGKAVDEIDKEVAADQSDKEEVTKVDADAEKADAVEEEKAVNVDKYPSSAKLDLAESDELQPSATDDATEKASFTDEKVEEKK